MATKGTILVTGDNGSLGSALVVRRVSTGEIPPIRALILNAAFQDFGNQSWTDDGFDTVFASNYLGHWLLTLLLLGSMDMESGRIVVLGSQSHDTKDTRNEVTHAFDDPKYKTVLPDSDDDAAAAEGFNAIARGQWSPAAEDATFAGGYRRYGASKLFLLMMQHELQARLLRSDSTSRICVLGIIFPIILFFSPGGDTVRSPARSAGDVLEAALGYPAVGGRGEADGLPRDLYLDGRRPCGTSEEARDAGKRALVWRESVRLAGLREGETVLGDWR
ncbi:hypothetical protein KVR01_007183 [Diaporthe batatas]|uniref:uncharacterized protein n=1 Tax=Diaporthe batatas TaxID=748121 RepID=UPI001D04E9F1|nr:uncharacterized protein KVR01_007183 [Diaporthe batatas]KAG8162705.1 hypothetical protein KVR01_007183 [Diaporthe batatas]